MKIIGILLLLLGLALTVTLIFSFIGIPMMFIGAILIWAGRSPATIVIHNQTTNSGEPGKK